METTELGKHIRQRAIEKRKTASALRHSAWLLLAIGVIILFTLARVILMFAQQPLAIPVVVWAMLPVHGVQLILLAYARVNIKKSELHHAIRFAQWSALFASALTVLLLIGWSQWLNDMLSVSRTAHGAWMVLMIFLSLNYLMATIFLFRNTLRIKTHQIHSMQMDTFDKGLQFWAFLAFSTCALLITLS